MPESTLQRSYSAHHRKTDKTTLLFGIAIFFKFLLFDFIWSLTTTFASFSTIEFYTTKLIATLILIIPFLFLGSGKQKLLLCSYWTYY